MSAVRINVEYFAQARAVAGRPGETLDFASAPTLTDLAHELAARYGGKMRALLLQDDGLAPSMIFAVNGRQVSPGEELALTGGETVVIIPPISGGGA